MAEKENMWEDNVTQRNISDYPIFYVDRECILCSVCEDAAPANFRCSDEDDHNIVYKQPEDPQELEQCIEAMENCPVDAIGNDGPR